MDLKNLSRILSGLKDLKIGKFEDLIDLKDLKIRDLRLKDLRMRDLKIHLFNA